MARNRYAHSEVKYKRWIKEGRGQDLGPNYQPWITVRDVPSEGRSHRVFGHKSQRTHHLLSDLELAIFLSLEWNNQTLDIREQFPLEREETLNIADDFGIKHPSEGRVKLYMSSDFLVDSSDPERPKYAIQAKYTKDLQNPRTVEKLEIERRYWALKKVPWFVVTEKDVSKELVQNISWIYPAERDELEDHLLIDRTAFYSELFQKNPNKTVVDICKYIDLTYHVPNGTSLYEVRQLVAHRCFYFDMSQPFHLIKCQDLIAENMTNLIGALNVSNQ